MYLKLADKQLKVVSNHAAKRKKSKAKAFDPDAIIAAVAGGESPMDLPPEAAPGEEAQLPGGHLLLHLAKPIMMFTKDFLPNPICGLEPL